MECSSMLKALGLIFRFIRKQKQKRKALKQHHRRSWTAAEAPAHLCQMGWLAYTSRGFSAWPEEHSRMKSFEISLSLCQHCHLLAVWSVSTPQAKWKVYPTLYPQKCYHKTMRGLHMQSQPTIAYWSPFKQSLPASWKSNKPCRGLWVKGLVFISNFWKGKTTIRTTV